MFWGEEGQQWVLERRMTPIGFGERRASICCREKKNAGVRARKGGDAIYTEERQLWMGEGCGEGVERIQRLELPGVGQVGIDFHGDFDGGMAHEQLRRFHIHAGIIEHGAIAMAQIVHLDADGLPCG